MCGVCVCVSEWQYSRVTLLHCSEKVTAGNKSVPKVRHKRSPKLGQKVVTTCPPLPEYLAFHDHPKALQPYNLPVY